MRKVINTFGRYVVSVVVNVSCFIATISPPVAAAQDCPVLFLDGINDGATGSQTVFPNSSTLQSFTVEGWFKPNSAGSFLVTDDAYDLILFSDLSAGNGGVGIKFTLWGSGGSTSRTEFRDVRLNQWNHIAAMFDASQRTMRIPESTELKIRDTER